LRVGHVYYEAIACAGGRLVGWGGDVGGGERRGATFGTADVCEADTRVAGGAFDHSAAWLDEAFFFGIFDDVEGCAVCASGGVMLAGCAWLRY